VSHNFASSSGKVHVLESNQEEEEKKGEVVQRIIEAQ
jgi:hypothetical protein